MHRTSSGILIPMFVMIALVVADLAPATPSQDTGNASARNQITKSHAGAAPLVVAQGRCFNGRCF